MPLRVLLFGATGRTGRLLLPKLEAAGHEAVTYGRRPGGGARALVGAVDNREGVAAALDGVDAVVSCLASTNTDPVCSTATRTLMAADIGQRRLVVVSGANVVLPGDRRGRLDDAAQWVFRQFLGGMLADRQRELDVLQGSSLRWTALRPPRLTGGRGSGAWHFSLDRPALPQIARADLAGAVVEALDRDGLIGQAPFVSARPRKR